MPEEVHSDPRLSAPAFHIIPAIDLLSGACVRLYRGRYDEVTRYQADPVEIARAFEAAGARWIHLVDLDAARGAGRDAAGAAHRGAGTRTNRAVIARIRRTVSCRLEAGGGIRSQRDVEELFELGVDRLVLGTVVAREPGLVASWCGRHGQALMAGIDADAGKVKVAGWEQDGAAGDLELARRVGELGMAGIVYTAIARDGTLAGPDLERTNRVAEAASLPVVVSGGVGGPADVERVARERHPGICGVIVGKAIYEGRVDLADLIRRFQSPGAAT